MAHLHNIIFLLKDAGFWKEAYCLTLLQPELAFNKEIGKVLVSKLPKSNSHALYEKIILSPFRRFQFWGECGFILSEAALQMTARANLYENAKFIVSRGHNPSSSLFYAAEVENLAMVQLFLKYNADPSADNGKDAMTLKQSEYISSNGSDTSDDESDEYYDDDSDIHSSVNWKKYINTYKVSALWIALDKKNDAIVKLLIQYGADVNCRGLFNKTPLHMAFNNLNIIKLLVENGADVNALTFYKDTLLILTVERYSEHSENLEVIEYLVDHGAKVNACNCNGKPILMEALFSESFELVKYLISKGANVNASDNDGNSVLTIFLKSSMFSIEHFLVFLNNGANLNHRNKMNETPLIFLCRNTDHLLAIQCLIKYGADIDARDNKNRTALDISCSRNSLSEVKKSLLEHGAMCMKWENRIDCFFK